MFSNYRFIQKNMLKPKQQRFVNEYLIDLNATQAAIRAGYSQATARQIGQKLLTKVDVQVEVKRQQEFRAEKSKISQERVLLEIARLAFNDPRKVIDEQGNIKPVSDWNDDSAACISNIKMTTITDKDGNISQTREIKFWDKGKQLELASKHLGLLTENINQNIKSDHQIVILELPDNGRDQDQNQTPNG